MKRIHKLAAEIFAYSYNHYSEHLGTNARFDRYMPEAAKTLEKAVRESWPAKRVAEAMDCDIDDAKGFIESTRAALKIVDAPTMVESYRSSLRRCIQVALKQGLETEKDIEGLVIQICYRTADFGFVLEANKQSLSECSEALREEPDWYLLDQ